MNLLVTSINAKIPLLECIREAITTFDFQMKLFGADSNATVLGRYFVDNFWHMPRLEELTCKEVIAYCQTHKIGYIVPTRDEDVLFFATHQEELATKGIRCFVSNLPSIMLCYDKLAFADSNASRYLIETTTTLKTLTCERVVVKERFGSGSKLLLLNATQEEASLYAKKLSQPIFQPFIQGTEYSIDSYITQEGMCIGSVCRVREKVVQGESKITYYTPHESLVQPVEKLITALHLHGHIITQAIVNNEGIFIIECNARFGGASTLSYRMGLQSFLWFLQESNHQPIKFTLNTDITRLVRVEQDVYFAH